jgi:hypothetical protein
MNFKAFTKYSLTFPLDLSSHLPSSSIYPYSEMEHQTSMTWHVNLYNNILLLDMNINFHCLLQYLSIQHMACQPL